MEMEIAQTSSSPTFYPEQSIPNSLAEYEDDGSGILQLPKVGEVIPLTPDNKYHEGSNFPTIQIENLPETLALFQGGMGLKLSNSWMAGEVAAKGAAGIVTSVMFDMDAKENSAEVNREAFARELQNALIIAGGNGLIGANIMHALGDYPGLVQTALENGAQFLMVGAGLPLDLAKLAKDYPDVALIPIVSGGRALTPILKEWAKFGRKPGGVMYENPNMAGGHEGGKLEEILGNSSQYFFRYGIAQCFDSLAGFAEKTGDESYLDIPVIAAGGINPQDLTYVLNLSRVLRREGFDDRIQRVAGIQIATPFLTTDVVGVTERDSQLDIHANEKLVQAHLRNQKERKTAIILSTAGKMPGRVLMNQFIEERIAKLQKLGKLSREKFGPCVRCLSDAYCKLNEEQWCIMQRLSFAQRGKIEAALIFSGRNPQHLGKTTVKEVIDRYLNAFAA
jgi:nitronate monooxygenase